MLRAMRFAFASIVLATAVAACGGKTPTPTGPEPGAGPDLSPALAPVRWMVGDWEHEGGREHWVAAAGVFYGVAFNADGSFEAMVIDDATEDAEGKPDGTLRFYAMPNGAAETLFTATSASASEIRFENPQHDNPTAVVYAPADQGLSATLVGPDGENVIPMASASADTGDDAEAADLAFARDTDAGGAKAWASYFSDDGAMLRGGKRIEGSAAIQAEIAPLLGKADLLWAPTWSRISPDGRMAATVGRARIVEKSRVIWRGSYLTVWRAEAEGWKVVADVGRAEQPLQ